MPWAGVAGDVGDPLMKTGVAGRHIECARGTPRFDLETHHADVARNPSGRGWVDGVRQRLRPGQPRRRAPGLAGAGIGQQAQADAGADVRYGPELEAVIKQQDKVFREIRKQHWSRVVDEAVTWTEQTRVLSGYAGASHDPARFQMYCEQLLAQVQAVRDSAVREDSVHCEQAFRACDPILNRFSRDFPIARSPRRRRSRGCRRASRRTCRERRRRPGGPFRRTFP